MQLEDWMKLRRNESESASVAVLPPIPVRDASSCEVVELAMQLCHSIHLTGLLNQATCHHEAVNGKLDEMAHEFATKCERRIEEMSQNLTVRIKALLLPLLENKIEEQAIQAFVQEMQAAVSKKAKCKLLISAPKPILDRLKSQIRDIQDQCELDENSVHELRGVWDGTELISHLAQWQAHLSEALA